MRRAKSSRDQCETGVPASAGLVVARTRTLWRSSGGKSPWPARPRAVLQPLQALRAEALAPARNRVGVTAEFGGHLGVGDTDGVINGGPGLLDALGADVVLVVRDHGPTDPGRVDEQIHTFGVCNPTCTDLQMSMHTAG